MKLTQISCRKDVSTKRLQVLKPFINMIFTSLSKWVRGIGTAGYVDVE